MTERATLLQLLGMAPEPVGIGPFHPDAFAASTGELLQWMRERFPRMPYRIVFQDARGDVIACRTRPVVLDVAGITELNAQCAELTPLVNGRGVYWQEIPFVSP